MRTSSSELLIELDRSRPRGLRVQIEHQLRDAVHAGRLPRGTVLPSSRALAEDLGITRGVVVAAYEQLVAEGYLAAVPGSGTVVNRGALPQAQSLPVERPSESRIEVDFSAGLPDLALFPRSRWARASRVALQTVPDERLGYCNARGLPELQSALIDYLARVRGVRAHPDQVVMCSGFSHAITVLAEALARRGHHRIAVEDPHRGAGPQLEHSSLRVHGVELDAEGIVVDALRRTGARTVLVTPAHQAPTGVVLSSARRSALVNWAHAVDGYVIEDDYDAEFRYDHHPVGSLQGIAPDRVVYCGTASKTLAPGIRLGWMVLPPPLIDAVMDVRRGTDVLSSALLQATFAAFVADGDLDRHLRRVRRIYRRRRDALVAAVAKEFAEARPMGVSAGLQTLLALPAGWDEAAVARSAGEAGVRLRTLSEFRMGNRTDLPPALVLGYGQLAPAEIERGVRLLATAARSATS
ncbi:MAG TPA: PLP-dependent aminotransferase family protein [Acidimicrobiales bacterium]|nr:PLP-dependent aminotransferase family protein [Acidimicrobiales bacterium]